MVPSAFADDLTGQEPRVVIAAPLYNNAQFLEAALESLLAQTYPHFRLLLLDDCSTDDTEQVSRSYAQRDRRVLYLRNRRRLGLLENWRQGFALARHRFPHAAYFAWASDHDRWRPRWLEALVDALDDAPHAVLAYPETVRISASGTVTRGPFVFDTEGVTSPWRRVALAYRGMVAGTMVYGLFRADALAHAGALRSVLSPDRLLLTELAFEGEFRQVREVLWERRFEGLHTHRRQRSSFYPQGAPAYTFLPVPLTHIGAIFLEYVVRGAAGPRVSPWRGVAFTAFLVPTMLGFEAKRAALRARKRVYRVRKLLRKEAKVRRLRKQLLRADRDLPGR